MQRDFSLTDEEIEAIMDAINYAEDDGYNVDDKDWNKNVESGYAKLFEAWGKGEKQS